ncbi:MAG: BlaI/MecI/CopY family transcriptional regulator [Gemmatimonadaceae bacterium]
MRKPIPLPTDAELEILRVLWDRGPSTVREVHSVLGPARDTGYTGILKLLQIMLDKRLVDRDDRARSHVYRAAVDREATEQRIVADFAVRAFGGSAAGLALRALSATPATPAELKAIRELVARLEREQR